MSVLIDEDNVIKIKEPEIIIANMAEPRFCKS
jgi:hypothetical protein